METPIKEVCKPRDETFPQDICDGFVLDNVSVDLVCVCVCVFNVSAMLHVPLNIPLLPTGPYVRKTPEDQYYPSCRRIVCLSV